MLYIIVSGIILSILTLLAVFVFVGILSPTIFFLLIAFLVLFCVTINVIINCRRYGKENVFSFLKKKDVVASGRDIFIDGLQSQINTTVLLSKENIDFLVCLNQNGVYLFYLMDCSGIIYERENKWYRKTGKDEEEIENPFSILKKEENKLESLVKVPIHTFMVSDSETFFQKTNSRYPILKFSNAYYYLYKVDMKEKYTKEDLDQIMEKLKDNYC